MQNKDDFNPEKFQGFIEATEILCRKFEDLKEWEGLTLAEKLKKGLTEFFKKGELNDA